MDTVGMTIQELLNKDLVSPGDKVLCVYAETGSFIEGQVYDIQTPTKGSTLGVKGVGGAVYSYTGSTFEVLPEDDDPLASFATPPEHWEDAPFSPGDKVVHRGEVFTVRYVKAPASLFGPLVYLEEKLGGFSPKYLIGVGDYVTWGGEFTARRVTKIVSKYFKLSGKGFLVTTGEVYEGYSLDVELNRCRKVDTPAHWPSVDRDFEDQEILSIASAPPGSLIPIGPGGIPPVQFQEDDGPDQSQKADAGKIDPRMIEVDLGLALSAIQAVLEYGKAKYGQRAGWKQVDIDRYEPAARRHRISRDLGEERDAESGLLHLAHEITNNLFILQTMIEQSPDVDFTTYNRPPTDHRKAA